MMKILTLLFALAALGCAVAIAVAGPGTQMGWWGWGDGLGLIRKVSAPLELGPVGLPPIFTAAALAGLTGILSFFMGARAVGGFAIVAAVLALGATYVPLKMKTDFESNPFIHDITTDFENPPEIKAAADLPRANPPEYLGDELTPAGDKTVRQAQADAFPDIGPKSYPGGIDEVSEIVRHVVQDMNMEILHEGTTDNGWALEAAYTSKWFGFIDDFVVRLTPDGANTRIDVRSKSRVGGSDLGANAKRVRAFYEKMDTVTA